MATITQQDNRWGVAGNIEMDNANALLEESKALSMVDAMVIDFEQVDEVDTSAVSLMLAWLRRGAAENKQVTFANLPKGIDGLVNVYGLADLIQ